MSEFIFKIDVNYQPDYNYQPAWREMTLEQYFKEFNPGIDEVNQMFAEGYCYLERIEK